MRVAVVQVGYGDGEPVAERTERVARAGPRPGRARPRRAARAVGARGLLVPRAGPSRAEPLDGPTDDGDGRGRAGRRRRAARRVDHRAGGGRRRPRRAGPRAVEHLGACFGPDGALLATYRKVHRFGFGEGEPQLLEAGEDVVTVDVPRPTAAGDDVRLGLATCYDLRFPELFRRLLDAGAQVVVVPAAWPAARVAHWTLLGRARAIEDQVFVVACNTAGTHCGSRDGRRQPGRRARRARCWPRPATASRCCRSSWTSTAWTVCGNGSRCSTTGGCDGLLPGRVAGLPGAGRRLVASLGLDDELRDVHRGADRVGAAGVAPRSSPGCSSARTRRRRGTCSPAA